jgi:pantoate--beta-alanine ligase
MHISVKRIFNKPSFFVSVSTPHYAISLTELIVVLKDLLISHPTPENMHIIPTSRDPTSNLALSSRNAYLSEAEMEVAPILYRALSAAKEGYSEDGITGQDLIKRSIKVVEGMKVPDGVELKVDYFEVFDKETFEPVLGPIEKGRELVIAGAVWVGKTRLIDNLLLGWEM